MGRLFGTNGVRGVANVDLTPALALRLGRAIASSLPDGSTLALARDARTSGPMLGAAASAGLQASGLNVVDLGIVPTPAAQYFVKTHEDVAGALVVTASHNPPEFNGLKLVSRDGTEASPDEEALVEGKYFDQAFRESAWDAVGSTKDHTSANETYAAACSALVDRERVAARGWTIAFDAGGGPGALTTPNVLSNLGCKVVPIFNELDGTFSGRPSEPIRENLSRLIETVKGGDAGLGIAHDGDADRCVFVDDSGRWVSGDQSLALLARDAVKRAGGGIVCTPVSTSSLVDEVVQEAGGKVQYTAVGSPIVARAMMEAKAVFGGEENGGTIFPEHQYCRDAAATAARMLDFLSRTEQPLSAHVDALPTYYVTKQKFHVPVDQREPLLARVKEWVRSEHAGARVDDRDGVKVYLPDGWVLIRPSGTEPIFRVYAESKNEDWAQRTAGDFVKAATALVTA